MGNFYFILSFDELKIPIRLTLPFVIVEPLDNKIFVSFGPKIEFNISKIEGDALLIPSIITNLLEYISLFSIALHKGVFEFIKTVCPSLFFLRMVLHNKSSTFVDLVIVTLIISKFNKSEMYLIAVNFPWPNPPSNKIGV